MKLTDAQTVAFWAQVSGEPSGCWQWMGKISHKGYGIARVHSGGKKRDVRAHRLAYILVNGPVPADLVVRHIGCRNRACVNPAHLAVGTYADNSADMLVDGTRPMGSRHWAAKITEADAVEIRRRAAAGEPRGILEREFGIAERTVSQIIRRITWRHV